MPSTRSDLKSLRKQRSKGSSSTSSYERISPSKNPLVTSSHPMLTRTRARCSIESPLALPSALLPPIADSTTRILGLVNRHCGDMDPDVDIIKNMVLESHKELDQWARQEINSRDEQIEEERRLAENKKLEVSEQDIQIHELKGKELSLTNKLETCQTQLLFILRAYVLCKVHQWSEANLAPIFRTMSMPHLQG
ncbi:hypothetical protein F5877DRAFT_68403 [Lentinula edodes]|nr:hypothetical protein F5877DRAFT_68403 [Lentinula edodes]